MTKETEPPRPKTALPSAAARSRLWTMEFTAQDVEPEQPSTEAGAELRELVEGAMTIPGVAEAMDAYTRVAGYVLVAGPEPVAKAHFAAGGNG